WSGRLADVLVLQNEFAKVSVPISSLRAHGLFAQSVRRRRAVSVKRRIFEAAVARPKAATGHFMRIGFAGDGIDTVTLRGGSARETSHGEIERPPEEVHRTRFADVSRPEFLEYPLRVQQDGMKALDVVRVVRSVVPVLVEGRRVIEFNRPF